MNARLHRKAYNIPGESHELTFSCYRRLKLLTCECIGRAQAGAADPYAFTGCPLCGRRLIACRWLADAINQASLLLGFAVLAYVFMPEHVHLIIHPRQEAYEIAAILRQIKEPVARRAVAFLKRQSPEWLCRVSRKRGTRVERLFWQSGGGYDRNINESRTRDTMIEYVHDNPRRRGLVESRLDWPFSSARWYEDLGEGLVKVEVLE